MFRKSCIVISFFLAFAHPTTAAVTAPQSAYVRVSQVGYESGKTPFRAYLMATTEETGATFRVLDGAGHAVYASSIGQLLGTWSNSKTLIYQVYALDFQVSGCARYSIAVVGRTPAASPEFAVDRPEVLYSGLLLNSKFFYETERDGLNFKPNALRTAPGHLNDRQAKVFETPLLDDNDLIATSDSPLKATGGTINAEGGWWDAGDYMKYVETISYTVALQEIGVRDFPRQMGNEAVWNPPAPPLAISYAVILPDRL